jgi:RHS repeat-associated protein
VAAIWSQGTSAYGDVFRYDPYGETIAAHSTGASRTPWRYQGRLVEGDPGDAELYDFGFRSYAADTGSFASLDDVAGGAHDVRSLNRFLYAHADPVTLIDPDGHKIEGPQSGQFEVGTTAQVIAKYDKAATASAKSSSADAGHAKRPAVMVKADTWWAGTQVPAPAIAGGPVEMQALWDACLYGDDSACVAYDATANPDAHRLAPEEVLVGVVVVVGAAIICIAACAPMAAGAAAFGGAIAAGQGIGAATLAACVAACTAAGIATEFAVGTACGCLVGGETPAGGTTRPLDIPIVPPAVPPRVRNGHLAGQSHPITGVPFDAEGFPDFSSVAIRTVVIEPTGSRAGDYRAANAAAGLKSKPIDYTWHHHQDGVTMLLVPYDIHQRTGHHGGFSLPH